MESIIRQPKQRGELAELRFLLRVAEEGLAVSKPYGDSQRFDFVVGSRRPLYRVQVRSVGATNNSGGYTCVLGWGHPHKAYERSDFDFLALYVTPFKTWYIMPMRLLPLERRCISVFPHHHISRSGWERFREAWHLLGA